MKKPLGGSQGKINFFIKFQGQGKILLGQTN